MIDICPICQIATPCDCDDEDEARFTNRYYCKECDLEWEMTWSCMCNDKCPRCTREIEPYESEDNNGE